MALKVYKKKKSNNSEKSVNANYKDMGGRTSTVSKSSMTFSQAFKKYRAEGAATFPWNGKRYSTKTKEEVTRKATRKQGKDIRKAGRAEARAKGKTIGQRMAIRRKARQKARANRKQNRALRK